MVPLIIPSPSSFLLTCENLKGNVLLDWKCLVFLEIRKGLLSVESEHLRKHMATDLILMYVGMFLWEVQANIISTRAYVSVAQEDIEQEILEVSFSHSVLLLAWGIAAVPLWLQKWTLQLVFQPLLYSLLLAKETFGFPKIQVAHFAYRFFLGSQLFITYTHGMIKSHCISQLLLK